MGKFEDRKEELGQATPGTDEYNQNAACILGSNPDYPGNQEKLRDLANSNDPITRSLANSALQGRLK